MSACCRAHISLLAVHYVASIAFKEQGDLQKLC